MADKFGQFDNRFSGAADVWDDGLAGAILLLDYFDAPEPEPPEEDAGSGYLLMHRRRRGGGR